MRHGFSLVELMVAIAIVAIVAAIIFPVYTRARAKGRLAACQINLRQISVAVIEYMADYDGVAPGCRKAWQLARGRSYTTWHILLWPYVGRWGVYRCPSTVPYSTVDNVESSYGMNVCVVGDFIGQRLDQTRFPSSRVLVADSLCCGISSPDCACSDMQASHVYPHNNGANLAFVDGHIKWRSKSDIVAHPGLFDTRMAPVP